MSNGLYNTIIDIRKIVKSKLIFILIPSILASILMVVYLKSFKGKYEAKSKIFPLVASSLNAGPFDALKQQFGLSEQNNITKIYNIDELLRSKRLSKEIVMHKSPNSKYATIAAWVLDDYNYGKTFFQKTILIPSKDTQQLIEFASSVYRANLDIETEKSEFMNISTNANSSDLALVLNHISLEVLSDFYISFSTEKSRTDLSKIKIIRDSLKLELQALESAIAGFNDANRFVVNAYVGLPQAKLMRAKSEIEVQYGMAANAYQNARYKLLSESPIFQVLDKAESPSLFKPVEWKQKAIVMFIIVFVLGVIFFSRKLFWNLIITEIKKI